MSATKTKCPDCGCTEFTHEIVGMLKDETEGMPNDVTEETCPMSVKICVECGSYVNIMVI